MNSVKSNNNLSLKYQRFTPSGCKIQNQKIETKTQFFYLCFLHLCLDLAVCIVDDGEEHVEKDEENNEDVEEEESRSKNIMSSL